MEKLKKVVIKKPGGYEKLKLEEFNEIPVPRENEVLI